MITTRIYLDCRRSNDGAPAPLKLAITKNKVRSLVPLNISLPPVFWNKDDQVALGCYEHLNVLISQKRSYIETLIFQWQMKGESHSWKSSEIKDHIIERLYGVNDSEDETEQEAEVVFFKTRFNDFKKRHAERTIEIYEHTAKRIKAFIGEKSFSELKFEDITLKWLKDFDDFLAKTSPSRNARNIHFRNIRAVFNDALDDEVITCYPFRKFKIRAEKTRKRSLSVDDIRTIFTMDVEPYAEIYRDMFKLIFFLIGINTVDLHRLKSINKEGRVEFRRAKTHRDYSIKVEPEAKEIMERYQGKRGLLSISDRWKDHIEFRKKLNMALKKLGAPRSGLGGKKGEGLWPDLTSYWARHSWATIARKIGISKDTIAQALGHGGNTVTDIYIEEDMTLVDEANRKVIDWVLYGKK